MTIRSLLNGFSAVLLGSLLLQPVAFSQAQEADEEVTVEVEVDTVEQLEQVLPAQPDVVLLDNMPPTEAGLYRAVAMRDALAPTVQLEASGGVNLTSVRAVADSGVERIAVGALTHSAASLDIGLDR